MATAGHWLQQRDKDSGIRIRKCCETHSFDFVSCRLACGFVLVVIFSFRISLKCRLNFILNLGRLPAKATEFPVRPRGSTSLSETRKSHCFGGSGVPPAATQGVLRGSAPLLAVTPLGVRGSPSSDYTPLELKLILNSTRRKALSVTWPLHGNGKSPSVITRGRKCKCCSFRFISLYVRSSFVVSSFLLGLVNVQDI